MADINALIGDARGFAASTFSSAKNQIDTAASAIGNMGATYIGGIALPNLGDMGVFVPAKPPALATKEFNMPARPGAPEAPTPIPDPTDGLGNAPVLMAIKPNINVDGIPRPSQLAEFDKVAPVIRTSFDFPDAPDFIEPAAPILADRVAPVKPELIMPVFDAQKPDDLAPAPTDLAEKFTAAYRDAAPGMIAALDGHLDSMLARYNPQYQTQMAALEDKLTRYLQGGTALTPATENAIYERSRDKVSAETRRAREAAFANAAKRGFTLPNGSLQAALQRARQDGADNNSRAAVEIAVKQAELEQQNIQFAMTTSAHLRTAVLSASISFHQNLISLNGQALDSAKSILSAMIEVYNGLVREYQARLEGYKAEAVVFETRLKGVLALIDLYEKEISALLAMTQVDTAKVAVYREQINALTQLGNLYRTKIEAVVSEAGLEKLKLELFSQQVQTFAVQTQAKSAEWQGFTAAMNGEEAKARVYGTEVGAYVAEWSGFKAKVDAKSEQVRAVALSNQAKATYAASQVSAFSALIGAESSRVSSEIQFQQQLIQEYAVANQAALAAASSATENYKAKGQLAVSATSVSIQGILGSAQLRLAQAKAVADTAMTAGSVYGNLASAALSGMNTLVVNSAESAA